MIKKNYKKCHGKNKSKRECFVQHTFFHTHELDRLDGSATYRIHSVPDHSFKWVT